MSNKDEIKKASLIEIADERLQCAICTHLVIGPLQVKCSHLICTSCARGLKQQRYECMPVLWLKVSSATLQCFDIPLSKV